MLPPDFELTILHSNYNAGDKRYEDNLDSRDSVVSY